MGKDLCLLPCSSTAASALILQGRSSSGKPMRCSQTSSLGWGCLQPPGEMNHKQGTKLSRALRKFQVCRREVKSGRCPRLSVRVGNRWQRGQKKIPAKTRRAWVGGGVMHRTGLRLRRGFTQRVFWPDPVGWHRVPWPREGRGLDGCCSLTSIRAGTSPRCHNYSEVPASAGGRVAWHRRGSPGVGAAGGMWEQGGSLPPSRVYRQIKN